MVPVPVPAPVPEPYPDLFSIYIQFFNYKIVVQNLAFSVLEAAFFLRKLASKFRVVDFLTFYVASGFKSNC